MPVSSTPHHRPVVLLGGSIGSLSYARSLGRRGIDIHCLGTGASSPVSSSRYSTYREMGDVSKRESHWLEELSSIGRRQGGRGVLFPTGDDTVLFASRHAITLSENFSLNVPGEETVRTILDKKAQYRFAEAAGVPVPRTLYPDEEDIESIAEEMDYPCLLKPRHSRIWRATAGSKLTRVNSPGDLIRAYHCMARFDPKVMVQEMVPGGDDCLFGFLAYYGLDRRCLGWMTKRKLRQFPPLYGDGSLQESVREPRVEELSRRLLDGLGYRGMVGVEYKRGVDGEYRLIEINPRSVSGNLLATAAGVDLPFIAYSDICGSSAPGGVGFREGVRLINEFWDYRSFLEYRRAGRVSTAGWLRSVIGRGKVYAYFARDDPGPFMSLLSRVGSERLKRIGGIAGE